MSGKSQKITITSDKGRLGQDEINRMLEEAEKNAEADKALREAVEARNQLEGYLYGLRSTVQTSLKGKIAKEQEEAVSTLVSEGLSWLEAHPSVDKEAYEEKRKEVEAVASPIITAAYNAAAGTPGGDNSAAGESGAEPKGPTVEEVDSEE